MKNLNKNLLLSKIDNLEQITGGLETPSWWFSKTGLNSNNEITSPQIDNSVVTTDYVRESIFGNKLVIYTIPENGSILDATRIVTKIS
jgi:hypothetical protein